jgi:hypothetical protein
LEAFRLALIMANKSEVTQGISWGFTYLQDYDRWRKTIAG